MADIDALIQDLKTGDYYSRSTAARALGQLGGEKAAQALVDALGDEDDWVQEYAAEALGNLCFKSAVAPLGKLLESDNYKIRSIAAEALGRIGGAEAQALLEPLKDDSDSWVREAVRNALAGISNSDAPEMETEPGEMVYRDAPPESDKPSEPKLEISEAPAEPEEMESVRKPTLADQVLRTPEEIVELMTEGTKIKYKPTRSGFLLRVPVGGHRYQKVRLKFDSTDEEGAPIIQLFTVIGPAQTKHYRWALKLNPHFSYGAIGLVTIDGKELLAIMDTLLEENVDIKALKKSAWTLAKKGDSLERKLVQKDLW